MIMARPIRETPILSGKDARMFEKKMREVKNPDFFVTETVTNDM